MLSFHNITALSGQSDASLEGTVVMPECQWHTPLGHVTGSRDAPDRKPGSLSGKTEKRWPPSSPDSVYIYIHTSLPVQSPSGILHHALPLAHLPLHRQLAADKDVLGRCSPGYNSVQRVKLWGGGEEEVIRHWSRTNMNSGSMSPDSEVTCCCLFFANSRISLPVRAVAAPRLKVATLYRELDSNPLYSEWSTILSSKWSISFKISDGSILIKQRWVLADGLMHFNVLLPWNLIKTNGGKSEWYHQKTVTLKLTFMLTLAS